MKKIRTKDNGTRMRKRGSPLQSPAGGFKLLSARRGRRERDGIRRNQDSGQASCRR